MAKKQIYYKALTNRQPKQFKYKLKLTFGLFALLIISLWIHHVPGLPTQVTKKHTGSTTHINPQSNVTYTTTKMATAFGYTTVYSASLPRGVTSVTQAGVPGEMVVTYKNVTLDGKVYKHFMDSTKTKEPVEQISTVGTGPT